MEIQLPYGQTIEIKDAEEIEEWFRDNDIFFFKHFVRRDYYTNRKSNSNNFFVNKKPFKRLVGITSDRYPYMYYTIDNNDAILFRLRWKE